MVEVIEADAVLLRLLDIPCSATDLLIVATHREAAAKASRDAGIIEGLEMAAKVADTFGGDAGKAIYAAIRALIEEQKV